MNRVRRAAAAPAVAAAALAVAAAVAGCGGTSGASVATSACPDEMRAAGTLPELEALLPRGMIERSPDSVDSGWSCQPASLGTYARHGVGRLLFAGATWDYGGGDATVSAILATPTNEPSLQAAWVEEFYEDGARRGRKVDNLQTTRPTMDGAGPVWRLDVLNDLSLQTIVVWPASPYVRVVIVATDVGPDASREAHDQRVDLAVEVTSGGAPS